MTFEEFKSWIESNRDKPQAGRFLAAIEAATPDTAETILTPQLSAETVEPWLDSKDAFRVLQSRLDKAKNEAIGRFKEAELPKLLQQHFDTEYSKRHPPATEAEKQLAEIQRKFAEMEREKKLADIRTKALKAATEKKLPIDIVDVLNLDDEELAIGRIDKIAEILQNSTNTLVEQRMQGIKPEPRAGTAGPMKLDANAPLEARLEAKLAAASQPKGV